MWDHFILYILVVLYQDQPLGKTLGSEMTEWGSAYRPYDLCKLAREHLGKMEDL